MRMRMASAKSLADARAYDKLKCVSPGGAERGRQGASRGMVGGWRQRAGAVAAGAGQRTKSMRQETGNDARLSQRHLRSAARGRGMAEEPAQQLAGGVRRARPPRLRHGRHAELA